METKSSSELLRQDAYMQALSAAAGALIAGRDAGQILQRTAACLTSAAQLRLNIGLAGELTPESLTLALDVDDNLWQPRARWKRTNDARVVAATEVAVERVATALAEMQRLHYAAVMMRFGPFYRLLYADTKPPPGATVGPFAARKHRVVHEYDDSKLTRAMDLNAHLIRLRDGPGEVVRQADYSRETMVIPLLRRVMGEEEPGEEPAVTRSA